MARTRWRRLAFATALLLTLGGATTLMSASASAAPRIPAEPNAEICSLTSFQVCVNAWNGGPFVKTGAYNSGNNNEMEVQFVYGRCDSGDTTTTNCPYSGVPAGHVIFQMVFTGNGSWDGYCVGDAYNNPGDADTSLDGCNNPDTGYGGGYGTVFFGDADFCGGDGGSVYYSFHWPNGSMTTPNGSYGNEWYENGAVPQYCLEQQTQIIVTSPNKPPSPSPSVTSTTQTAPLYTPSS